MPDYSSHDDSNKASPSAAPTPPSARLPRPRWAAVVALSTVFIALAARAESARPDSGALTRAQVVERLTAGSVDHPPNFAGADLSSLDLSGLDFKRANLQNARLVGTKMVHANMFAVNMNGAVAREADFSEATLDISTMTNADFTHATFHRASLYAVIMTGANFTGADLTGARIVGAATSTKFIRAKLDHADLGADPRNQPMGVMRSDLTDADLSGADLTGANLRKAKLTRANLTGATLTGSDLSLAELGGAVFHQIVGRDGIKGLDQAKFRQDAIFDPR